MRPSNFCLLRAHAAVLLSVLLLACLTGPSLAQLGGPKEEDPIDVELRYADGLMRLGFPDYAKIVLGRLDPNVVGPRMKVLQLQSFIAVGNFDEVKRLIAKEPSQSSQSVWAMKLALADGYYAWGKYGDASKLYQAFFSQYPSGPPASLKKFFLESAYKYAQMLILMGQDSAAIQAYRVALRATPKNDETQRHIRRQMLGEMMELMVKVAEGNPAMRGSSFKSINDILNEILWVQDLWFGKAVVAMAHMRKMEGKIDDAKKLLRDYGPQLLSIDKFLKEDELATGENLTRLSPMAEARYVLGTILHDEGKNQINKGDEMKAKELLVGRRTSSGGRTSGAIHHFAVVFANYPYTGWAAKAARKVKEIEELCQTRWGMRISVGISDEKLEAVLKAQLTQARVLYTQNRFEEAAELYLDVLNDFPEGQASVAGLADLARCYMELGEERAIDSEMVVNYLVERFCKNKRLQQKAGDTLLLLAGDYDARQRPDLREAIEKMFFQRFDQHPRVPSMVYEFGKRAVEEKEYEVALGHFLRIIEKFADTKLYELALNRAANCSAEIDKPEDEQKYLEKLVEVLEKRERPGHPLIATKFRMIAAEQKAATAARKAAKTEAEKQVANKATALAAVSYTKLGKLLEAHPGRNSPYVLEIDDVKKNEEILQATTFYKALNYSLLTHPTNKLAVFKTVAIKTFDSLIAKWPKSKFAPAALMQVGTLWTVLGDAKKAQEAFSKLEKGYPGSKESKNALGTQAFILLQLNMRKEAVECFKKMFGESAGKYTEAQILTAGLELAKEGEHDMALQAFNKVLATTKRRAAHERALLGKGKALSELRQFPEAAKVFKAWLKAYKQSKNSVEASFYASRAYSEQAKEESSADKRYHLFNDAVLAMRQVRMYDRSTAGRAKSDVGVARIHLARSVAEEKFGSPEKAKAAKNDAMVTLQSLIFFVNRSKPGVGPHLQEAYRMLVPLLMEQEKWRDSLENCDAYIKEFPMGKYLKEMRKSRLTSNMKAQMSGEKASSAPIAGGTGTNVNVDVTGKEVAPADKKEAEKPEEKKAEEAKPEAAKPEPAKPEAKKPAAAK